eukprot:TRINITY_DN3646_c0_g2_i7.p1 TRINITY_DN3646_c0_g2~~TRINITY_DN3646_c0_g2_i7.p1  ORF type:complete len:269 (+),score=56.06 TRINITY_DN3646_c0_g2_i7:1943-2749(+)
MSLELFLRVESCPAVSVIAGGNETVENLTEQAAEVFSLQKGMFVLVHEGVVLGDLSAKICDIFCHGDEMRVTVDKAEKARLMLMEMGMKPSFACLQRALGLDDVFDDSSDESSCYEAPASVFLPLFLECEPDILEMRLDGETLLHRCLCDDDADVALLLIEHGADVNALTQHDRATLLHRIMLYRVDGAPKVAAILLSNGAEVDLRDSEGRTPLHYAQGPRMAKILLEAGADITARDNVGNLPLRPKRPSAEVYYFVVREALFRLISP